MYVSNVCMSAQSCVKKKGRKKEKKKENRVLREKKLVVIKFLFDLNLVIKFCSSLTYAPLSLAVLS